jgi:hypothetical protein
MHLLLLLLACGEPEAGSSTMPPPPAATPEPTPSPTPDPTPSAAPMADPVAVDAAVIAPHLRDGERLAHTAFAGPLGAANALTLAVIERDGKLTAFALTSEGQPTRVDGPALHEEWQAFDVPAVLFHTIPPSTRPSAVVLGQCISGMGPTGAQPFPCNAVLTWDGSALRRDAAAEARITQATNAAEVRAALR